MNVYAQIKWNDLSSIYITFFVVDFFSILATLGLQAKNFISWQLPAANHFQPGGCAYQPMLPSKKGDDKSQKKFIYNSMNKYKL